MTAAYRLRGIGWFGGCVAAVLAFYLVSLHVAGERKKLETVNRRIAAAERDIRALETEFDTRANLVQLERWNGDTLALTAPVAGQYVADEAALASLDVNQPLPGTTAQPGMRQAALVVPAGVAQPAVAQPAVAMALAAVAPTAAPAAPAAKPATLAPAVAKARARGAEIAVARAAVAVAKVRPQAVAMLDRKLLSDSTLGDIVSGARHEAGPKR